MKVKPKVGTTAELTFVVETQHAIDLADGGMPVVLSSPWLIWFLENTAREAVLPVLEPGESTVGVLVELQHLAATPVGHTASFPSCWDKTQPPPATPCSRRKPWVWSRYCPERARSCRRRR